MMACTCSEDDKQPSQCGLMVHVAQLHLTPADSPTTPSSHIPYFLLTCSSLHTKHSCLSLCLIQLDPHSPPLTSKEAELLP